MVRSRGIAWTRIAALVLAAALSGCNDMIIDLVTPADSGTDSDSDTDTDSDTDVDSDTDALPDLLKAQIMVENDFPDNPVCLTTAFFDTPWPEGVPDDVGAMIPNPPIKKPEDGGPPFELTIPQPTLEGPYFLFVTVLFHDNCLAEPIGNLDWAGVSDNPVQIGPGTGTVNAGPIDLYLLPP